MSLMTYTLADVLNVDLENFGVIEMPEDQIPKEAGALCCEYVFGYSAAAHVFEDGHLVVIKDNEEEGGGDQCRLINSDPAAYCAAFALALADDAAQQSAELMMSNSVVQHLYPEMQAAADEPTLVIYRDAKTYRNMSFGDFPSRTAAEAAVAKADLKSQSVWYWAKQYWSAA